MQDSIGSSQALAGLTVTQSNGATFKKRVDITDGTSGTITITDTSDSRTISFLQGAVTADSFVTAAEGYNIKFRHDATFANAVTFQNTGTLDLGDSVSDDITFNGGVTENTSGTVTIDGTIASSDDAITFGDITIGKNLSVNSAGGAITIGAIIGISGSFDLSITSSGGSSNTVVVGAIGGSGNINTTAITGSTSVTLNGNITADDSSGNSVTITGSTINTGAITIDTNNCLLYTSDAADE